MREDANLQCLDMPRSISGPRFPISIKGMERQMAAGWEELVHMGTDLAITFFRLVDNGYHDNGQAN